MDAEECTAQQCNTSMCNDIFKEGKKGSNFHITKRCCVLLGVQRALLPVWMELWELLVYVHVFNGSTASKPRRRRRTAVCGSLLICYHSLVSPWEIMLLKRRIKVNQGNQGKYPLNQGFKGSRIQGIFTVIFSVSTETYRRIEMPFLSLI